MDIISQNIFYIKVVFEPGMKNPYQRGKKILDFYKGLHQKKLEGFEGKQSFYFVDYSVIKKPIKLGITKTVYRNYKPHHTKEMI